MTRTLALLLSMSALAACSDHPLVVEHKDAPLRHVQQCAYLQMSPRPPQTTRYSYRSQNNQLVQLEVLSNAYAITFAKGTLIGLDEIKGEPLSKPFATPDSVYEVMRLDDYAAWCELPGDAPKDAKRTRP